MLDGGSRGANGVASDVSVVVSTYDEARWDELGACMESLQRQTVAPLEVIVVVDHNERLLARARDAFPWARVVGNTRPRGLAGARNAGVEEAGGSIVAFIDDDAAASREWLERLSGSFAEETTVGVGGALLPHWVDGEASWLPGEFYWVLGCSYIGLPEQVAPVRNPIGANMAVRRTALREVGGFREGDEHNRPRAIRSRGVVRAAGDVPDDTDLAIRVSQRRPEAVWLYQPEATVHHVVPRERASLGYFLRRCFEEGSGKASLARLVGTRAGLASERRHAASVLPRGVVREVRAFLGGDGTAALRALFIVIGMVATGTGFIVGRLAYAPDRRGEPPSPGFVPVRVDDVELGGPLPALPASDPETGNAFGASLCLIRLHGRPLGLIEAGLPPGGLSPDALAACIEAELGDAVARHLRDDGIEPTAVTPAGIAGPDHPRCNSARERLIDRAPTVSIVICTRGRPESVRATLRSILGSSYPAGRYEVIVVDNASAGDPPVDLEGAEPPGGARLRVVPEPEPGLSHARNRGLAEAGGEIVVFADDDVEVDAEWLATLITPFELDPEVGATSGLTLPAALETPTERWVEGFGGRRGDFSRRVYDINDPPPDLPLFPFTVGDFGAGRNMAFRRDALAELGGFDSALGPGTLAHDGDDIEALLRVLLSGRRLVHDPAAIVWHAHPRNYDELEERVLGYGIGLTACLTRAVLDHPDLLVDLVRKLPRGVVFAAASSSGKNAGRPPDFPRSLARRELRGMAYGPIAYLRSRLAQRRRARAHARANSRTAEIGERPLRILYVTDEYPPYIGGAGRVAELFSRELSKRGHELAIATAWNPDAPAFESDGEIAVHRVRDTYSRMGWLPGEPNRRHAPPPFPDPEATVRLRRLITSFRPDVVPAYGWLGHSAAAALVGTGIPLVLFGQDYSNACARRDLFRKEQICSGPRLGKCLACATAARGVAKGTVATASVFGLRPLLRRKTAAVHGVSRYVATVLQRDLGIPAERAVVIPHFHEDSPGGPVDPSILERLPTEDYILFVGALRRVKGLPEVLAAYEKLEDPPPLVVVGAPTPDTPEHFPPGITVLTSVPHPTVMAMWERALFAVFPSTWPEPLATVVHEAMSKGRPVIATRVGGMVDMVDDGETGLLVEPGDVDSLARAMTRLIEDPSLRERLGAVARERAQRFTAGVVVPELERFYRETVAGFGDAGR